MDTTERARLRARAMGAGAVAVVSSDLIAILDALDAAERAERERDEARAEVERLRRELAEARGDFAQMREDRDAYKGALTRANELRIGDRAEARLDEREACEALCDALADEHEARAERATLEVTRFARSERAVASRDVARAIRARGEGGVR